VGVAVSSSSGGGSLSSGGEDNNVGDEKDLEQVSVSALHPDDLYSDKISDK
jgi:hypothetical protein